jgi:hypothetical protein
VVLERWVGEVDVFAELGELPVEWKGDFNGA